MTQFMERDGQTLTFAQIAEETIRAALPEGAGTFTDASYTQGAVDALLRLVFHHRAHVSDAATTVTEVLRDLGFTNYLVFGFGVIKDEDGTVFTGPYVEMRTAGSEEPHVLPIGVDQARIDWIDGIA